MFLDPFFTRHHVGLQSWFECLIDGTTFYFEPDKASESAAAEACRLHVGALVNEQDGDKLRPGRTLADRQRQHREAA